MAKQPAKRRVQGAIAEHKKNRVAAQAARARDLRMLRQLKREEARIKRQILAAIAAAAASSGPGYTGQSDGFMSYPVAGRVTSPFGYRTHPIYGYYGLHDGTDFGAGCGTPMRAVERWLVNSASRHRRPRPKCVRVPCRQRRRAPRRARMNGQPAI